MFNSIKLIKVGCTALIAWFLLDLSLVGASEKNYKPSESRSQDRSESRRAGGARGGCNALLPTLDHTVILLVPQEPLASTLKSHPTFFWYVAEEVNLPLRFTLLELGEKPIIVKNISRPISGINAFKLPTSIPPLKKGKTYRWTVTIVCSDLIPSKNLYAKAWLKRVSGINASEISEYAFGEVWYDELSTSYENGDRQTFNRLLEEVNLSELNYNLKVNFINVSQ
ncbi:DUF928 domain-containing protein [Myxosarcina sp. GI1]|uniref:DUF928 domain-containing protein n=1 Tax=Myxosarcina sp. GI1 TaxID=1541065 RepID=UPI0005698FA3|nr:DUF928 domain-containing protein [Myxosarcina sp. GI1]